MSYKYETHMHTAEASACATSTGAEMARAHKEAGYTGIFIPTISSTATPPFPGRCPGRSG